MKRSVSIVGLLVVSAPVRAGDVLPWPTFADETDERLVAANAIVRTDPQEKDYAWGDLDRDGDIDLVVVRKEPWNTPGRFRNVLLMNEGTDEGHAVDGVLVDRSQTFATASSDGSQGFLDATADRDVAILDVDGDTWLDIVTSTTYGEDLPKTISHPRVYRNLGEDGGVWQGFIYEEFRSPTMPMAPHFCGVGFGDVTNDGAPDLYFVDYNGELEDRIWINDGDGTFVDETESRLTPEMLFSDFGVHSVIADLNNDGAADIVKDRASTLSVPPLRVQFMWNDPDNPGFFSELEIFYNGSPYHVDVGDLNGDGRLDIVVDDDGIDRYFLNQGNGEDGFADFTSFLLPPASNGSGGNIVIADVNNDGFVDITIADVDVDCCGCLRHMHFWRSNGDFPDVTFTEESGDIPIPARTGTHDVAIFDINGDGWKDMVIGTCTGTSIWMAQPGLAFTYVNGRPDEVPPETAVDIDVVILESAGCGARRRDGRDRRRDRRGAAGDVRRAGPRRQRVPRDVAGRAVPRQPHVRAARVVAGGRRLPRSAGRGLPRGDGVGRNRRRGTGRLRGRRVGVDGGERPVAHRRRVGGGGPQRHDRTRAARRARGRRHAGSGRRRVRDRERRAGRARGAERRRRGTDVAGVAAVRPVRGRRDGDVRALVLLRGTRAIRSRATSSSSR